MSTWFSLYILIINAPLDTHHTAYHAHFRTLSECSRYFEMVRPEILRVPGQRIIHHVCVQKTGPR